MSNSNRKSQANDKSLHDNSLQDSAASDSAASEGPLDPLAAKLAALRPLAARRLEQKVFYEMGYQAGCHVAATAPLPKTTWQSSAKFYGLAAACIGLALTGGFIAGQWRGGARPDQALVALSQPPTTLLKDQPLPTEKNTAAETNQTQANTVADSRDPSPSWWPWSTDSRLASSFARNAQHGLRIGPVGSAWEDLVVSVRPPAGSHGSSAASPPIDAELQQILQLASPLTQPAQVQRLKKLIHPLL